MERSSKVFEGKIAHLDFRVIDLEIFEPIDGASLPENVVGADEDNVKFLQVAVLFAFAQSLAVTHGLVEACPLGDLLGVFHLHFDIKIAEGFAIGSRFFHEDVKADALADGAHFDGLFGFGVPEFVNLDAKNRLEEGLGDFFMAEHHGEHKFVGDG